MSETVGANTGSFRDPVNRVYELGSDSAGGASRILRGLSAEALATYQKLSAEAFFQAFLKKRHLVATRQLAGNEAGARIILEKGWKGVLEHEVVPFVSYPYEWTYSMLKDAALHQLHLIKTSLKNGWTLKDATPFNTQWIGPRPVFIDIPSFEPWVKGEPWVGYRQFCSMFLTPLMLRSHLGIDHLPLVRSYIDGIPPTEAIKFFTGRNALRKGVLSHIVLPARVERSIARRERDDAPARSRSAPRQTDAMVVGLVDSLSRLVKKLKTDIEHTDWSQYDRTHSYQEADFEDKKAFVEKHAAAKKRDHIWDIGCNTGTFSRICSPHCNLVVSIDGDHDAVEQLYLREKGNDDSNILPLVMNLSNMSPGQGWAGSERLPFDGRKKPDLVLCLALIHHIRLSANIPNIMFLRWLRSLDADVVVEFVTREDEMVIKLLTNKKEQYADYTLEQFVEEVNQFFVIEDRAPLKGGKREIFFLRPS